ncbi:putative aldehyde dehydrogenase (NAD(+)) [Helianthus annuus]|nr:putative aldehyde dehydrogenase (NAD(+)) [Helianthus annuus]
MAFDIAIVSHVTRGKLQVGLMVQQTVSQRFGKCLLELSGNNALIIMDDAYIKLAVRSVLFAAVGTAGQRCTTCRRLLVHEKVYNSVVDQLLEAYKQVKNGDPLEKGTLLGPLHTRASRENFEKGIKVIKSQTFEEAVEINNSVPQGFSSSIFTRSSEIIFKWIGPQGSDCGIVNANIPTNGC